MVTAGTLTPRPGHASAARMTFEPCRPLATCHGIAFAHGSRRPSSGGAGAVATHSDRLPRALTFRASRTGCAHDRRRRLTRCRRRPPVTIPVQGRGYWRATDRSEKGGPVASVPASAAVRCVHAHGPCAVGVLDQEEHRRHMRDTQPQGRRETYRARFTGGPWDRRRARLAAPMSGRPRDFVEVPEASDGAYAVAGAADAEGYVPYWWVSWASVATVQAAPIVRAVVPERERE